MGTSTSIARLPAAAGVALLLSFAANAQSVGLYLHLGSLGLGGDVGVRVSPDLTFRAGGNYFSVSGSDTFQDGDLDVDGSVNLRSFGGFVDYHPNGIFLRLTGGVVYSRNEIEATARYNRGVEIGNRVYSASDLGSLAGSIGTKNDVAPYAGIGFGHVVPRRRVSFTLDLGALYLGSAEIEMSGSGAIAPTADQAEELNDNLKNTAFYPVVTFGLTIRLAD